MKIYVCCGYSLENIYKIQSTLVISKSKGLSEILRDIRTSTYQICRIEEKKNWTTPFNKWICKVTPEVRDILKILWKKREEHFLLFSIIFCYLLLDFHVKTRTSLRKHAYSNILRTLPPKLSDEKLWYFHISAQNIDCGYSSELPRRGGSNEYPQSIVLIRNKKINVYPCKPQFTVKKKVFMGVKTI